MRREEGLNGDIKKFSKKQNTEKIKLILREPLRSLRLCVEKDVEIMHMVSGYSKTLLKKHDAANVYTVNNSLSIHIAIPGPEAAYPG